MSHRLALWSFLLATLMMSAPVIAEPFSLNEVPPGKKVTLPTMTTTVLAKMVRVRVTSTDWPQVLKISHRQASGSAAPMAIAIYDRHQERVRYATIHPRKPILYTFKDMGSIDIVAMNLRRGVDLALSSNSPIGLMH